MKTHLRGPIVDDMSRLQPSFNGKQVTINYELEFTIKHKGWNTDGKGKAVRLPIWIHSANPAESRMPVQNTASAPLPSQPQPQMQEMAPVGYPIVPDQMQIPQQMYQNDNS